MKLGIILFLSLFFSELAISAPIVTSNTEEALNGWWCYALAKDGNRSLRWSNTLDGAKDSARSRCVADHGGPCEVTQCYEANPYKYSCVGGKSSNETTIGGFRAFSNSERLAREAVLKNCTRRWGASKCGSICYPNFCPPKADALEEDLFNAVTFSKD